MRVPVQRFFEKLKYEFNGSFPDFEKIENVMQLVHNSFSLMPNGIWTSDVADVSKSIKAALQIEINEFQEDFVLKKFMQKFQKLLGVTNFGLKLSEKKIYIYSGLKTLAIKLCAMCDSIFVCEI